MREILALDETVREVGIRVLVFAPLDAAFAQGAMNVDIVSGIMLSALGLIVVGIILETGE